MALTAIAVLLRILSNPLANVFQKQLTERSEPPLKVNFITFLLLSAVCIVPATRIEWAAMPKEFWVWCTVAGIFGATGNGFLVKALQGGDLSVLGPINSYKSVVGMIAGILLLGDHVLFDITPNITAWPGYDNPLGGYLRSLERVRALPVKLPLPAHRTVQKGFIQRVDEIMAHHQRRCQEALTVLAREPGLNAYELTAQMTWQIRCKGWDDFPVPQKWFAVGEAVAHLEYLMDLGKVRRTWVEPCWRYEAVTE